MRKLILIIALILVFFCGNFTLAVTPTNVIVLIGDGMGFEHVKAAGMYANGSAGTLCFESFPYNGELLTYSASYPQITDSGAAGTAIATGTKVYHSVISIANPGDGSDLETMLERLRDEGKMTGLVTTTYMTHATPACFGAHEPTRDNYSNIAADYLNQTRPNILFGGGANGISAAAATTAGYIVVTDRTSMQALDTNSVDYVSGQFGSTHLPYEYDGLGSLPHLSEMTVTALDILDNEPNGFFLMVEGGRIDHAAHDNDRERMIHEAVEFDNSVQVVIDWAAGRDDTLILVTADHETGGLTVLANNGIGNYPTVSWSGGDHTAVNVPVYAWGVNSEMISGTMENTAMLPVVIGQAQAFSPAPADGATGVSTTADLSWSAGKDATSHDVYFGISSPGTSQGNQTATTFDPGILDYSTTYYWRINEVGTGGTTTGSVWSFTTTSGLLSAYDTVHVPGDKTAVFGSSWNPNGADNEMTLIADYTWRWESNVTSPTSVEYKFAMNGGWGINRGLGSTSGTDLPQDNWNLAQNGANIHANLLAATCVWEYYENTETSKLYVNVDFDIDGDVDIDDYAVFASHWKSQNCTEPSFCDGTDLNKSGSVDLYDLAQFVEVWLLDTSQ